MKNIEKILNEELRNNDCIENLVNAIDSKKSIYDAFVVDGKLVIVFNDELETNEVEQMQTMLKRMDGCGEVFIDEFELGYKGNFKSLTLDLLTDNISIGKFEQGGEMEDYYDGQGDEGYGNTFEELRSQIILGVMEDLRIPRETAQKVVDEKKEILTDLIENHGETNVYSLVQKAQQEDDSYSRHMETRKRLRNDEDTYPKGFNQFEKGGEVNKKSSIEWLFNHMGNEAAGYITEMDSAEALDYAKQMHKQEIMDAWKNADTHSFTEENANYYAERYYNETFLGAKRKYAKGGEIHTMSKKDKERFNELQKKDNQDKLTKVENVEYENLLQQYKKTKEYKDYFMIDKFAKGGNVRSKGDEITFTKSEINQHKKLVSALEKVKESQENLNESCYDNKEFLEEKLHDLLEKQDEFLYKIYEKYGYNTRKVLQSLNSVKTFPYKSHIYAKGGQVNKISTTNQVKRNLRGSGAFTLELEMAVYVPSTTFADQIISKTLFQKRIQEVEKYLSKLFGGYSSTAIDGGYVSKEKGLIKEDAAKVTAFGTEVAIKKNFKPLMRQISKWCESWGQESMGFEFEGDLYYVEKNAKFSKGGKIDKKPKFVKNAKK